MFELVCFAMVVLSVLGGSFVMSAQDVCTTFQCGENKLSISYPFWSLGDSHGYCGYQGFGIDCSHGMPILNVKGRSYRVKTINYTDQTLTAMDLDFKAQPCAALPLVYNKLSSSGKDLSISFYKGLETEQVLQFYTDCSSYPKSKLDISCLDGAGTNRSYFLTQDWESHWYKNCEEKIKIPVLSKVTNISNLSTYASVMQEGFQLTWFNNDIQCHSCERSGGRCRYSPSGSDTLVCVCSSGRIVAHGSDCGVKKGLCTPFQCGKNGITISYPFWSIPDSDIYCGYEGLWINCSDGKPILTVGSQSYWVKSINYANQTFTAVDLDFTKEPCATGGLGSKNVHMFGSGEILYFYRNCSTYPKSKLNVSCIDSTGTSLSYFVTPDPQSKSNKKCQEVIEFSVVKQFSNNINRKTYASVMQGGFLFRWYNDEEECRNCESSGGRCLFHPDINEYHGCHCSSERVENPYCVLHSYGGRVKKKVMIGVLIGIGSLFLIIIFVAYWQKFSSCITRRWSNKQCNKSVELFLENYGRLSLHRYTYSDIKTMTHCFKDKLGEGAYGGVFKGKLKDDGCLIAVKLLHDSGGKGEDFMNEVATIGRTNHINIVSLLGFCSEGSKRALVYEYMPNGSLEKFIYNEKNTSATHSLGEEKLYQIALGIANGLEYLHGGCNTRIVHFDIKPHNILLDKDFCPKISDFGLAKLCPTRESVVSMFVARGTMGYIAPEVYCRNFGGVSPKSDVYSYGMMVLEMVGGRKNIDATVDNASETYFPKWIYNHLEKKEHNRFGGFKEEFEEESTKKMIIVGLWCIQTHPASRPSISTVVEMLQKSVDELQMPPNPFLDPPTSSSATSLTGVLSRSSNWDSFE